MAVNENPKRSAHRQGHQKQNYCAKSKEGAGEIRVPMEEKEHTEDHGVGSHTGRKGSFDSRALTEKFLDARDSVELGNDCPDDSGEQQQIKVAVRVDSSIRVS
jgi:hypothetical protein